MSYTFRELVQTTLLDHPLLLAEGIAEGGVFDADTVDGPNPDQFPFLVHRWLDVESSMGSMKVRPFILYAYGQAGRTDKTVLERAARVARDILVGLQPVEKAEGWLHSFEDRNQGADLFDAGFNANVIPRNMVAIGSGD